MVESVHIRADFDQDRAGAGEVDTGNGLQEPQGTLIVAECGPEVPVDFSEGVLGAGGGVELQSQRDECDRVERGGERTGEVFQLAPHVGRQIGQDALGRFSGNQAVEDTPPFSFPQDSPQSTTSGNTSPVAGPKH